MDFGRSRESGNLGSENHRSPGEHNNYCLSYQFPLDAVNQATFPYPTVALSTQHSLAWNIPDTLHQTPPFPVIPSVVPASSLSVGEYCSLVDASPTGACLTQPQVSSSIRSTLRCDPHETQPTGLPYVSTVIQSSSRDAASEGEDKEECQLFGGPASRKLVVQGQYKPPRQQRDLEGPSTIDFFVCGQKGIRLSDALEGKFAGLEGRDDRPLFGNDRTHVMLRLQVLFPAPALDGEQLTSPCRLSGAGHGNQR